METNKLKILLLSPNEDFFQKPKTELSAHFEWLACHAEDDWERHCEEVKPLCVIVDGDSWNHLTGLMRQKFSYHQLGIIVISEIAGLFKEEFAFQAGADHYLAAPFATSSFRCRVESLLKRQQHLPVQDFSETFKKPTASSIRFRGLQIFPQEHLVKLEGEIVSITPLQFRLLVAFISRSDQLLSRDWLIENVWEGEKISPRSIDAQVAKLKKRIPLIKDYVSNIYGKGYIFSESDRGAA